MQTANVTQTFLGDEAQWLASHSELRDVEPLWGGRNIFVARSSRVIVQRVLQGSHQERRYAFELNARECQELWKLIIENDFLTIKPVERNGIPDEAQPSITLVNAMGDKKIVSKWAEVKNDRFDKVYAAVLHVETYTTNLDPMYTGPYDASFT